MSSLASPSRRSTQALGAAGLATIVGICGLLVATYQKAFVDVVHVTVEADRAGLLLDPGTRVRLAGVPVGEVRGAELRADGKVEIDVAIDEDKVDRVPADVSASIRGTTVFGSKFVDLQVPEGSTSTEPVAAGAVIRSDSVTVEVNDVFAHGLEVLETVDPIKLNGTLSSVSTALAGRGDDLGEFFVEWDRYFGAIEPHLGAMEVVLDAAPTVLSTYADVAPSLIATGDNLAYTSETLVKNADQFDALLRAAVTGAGKAEGLLRALDAPLRAFNEQWLPVTDLAAEYSPVYGCIFNGLANHVKIFDKFFGNEAAGEHYFYSKVGFLPGQAPYTLEENRPKLVTGAGPACYPDATLERPNIPRVAFDDGTKDIYDDVDAGGPAVPTNDPLRLYRDVAADWLGESGLAALLQGLVERGES